ncbi:MAG: hypothetical protein CM15mV11_2850 [Caudoviricetes sp.]|nr:MAG: hypothetical protein CM15mV11_2850 [Caudoviricetes sp.]
MVKFSDMVFAFVRTILSVPNEGPPPASAAQPALPVPSSAL